MNAPKERCALAKKRGGGEAARRLELEGFLLTKLNHRYILKTCNLVGCFSFQKNGVMEMTKRAQMDTESDKDACLKVVYIITQSIVQSAPFHCWLAAYAGAGEEGTREAGPGASP